MLTGFLIFELLPKQLMALFNAEGGLMAMGIRALRIFSVSFVFAAFGIMMTTMFQSLGMGITALIMSLYAPTYIDYAAGGVIVFPYGRGRRLVELCYRRIGNRRHLFAHSRKHN